MTDLNWKIEQENYLTDRVRFDFRIFSFVLYSMENTNERTSKLLENSNINNKKNFII